MRIGCSHLAASHGVDGRGASLTRRSRIAAGVTPGPRDGNPPAPIWTSSRAPADCRGRGTPGGPRAGLPDPRGGAADRLAAWMTLYSNLRNQISFTHLSRITEIYFQCYFQRDNFYII